MVAFSKSTPMAFCLAYKADLKLDPSMGSLWRRRVSNLFTDTIHVPVPLEFDHVSYENTSNGTQILRQVPMAASPEYTSNAVCHVEYFVRWLPQHDTLMNQPVHRTWKSRTWLVIKFNQVQTRGLQEMHSLLTLGKVSYLASLILRSVCPKSNEGIFGLPGDNLPEPSSECGQSNRL